MRSSDFDKAKLILSAALILGSIVRFVPTLRAGFPLNDGGMFLSMIRDLHVTGYVLPQVTSYNLTEIPYAYPPFGFYLARILADLGFNDIAVLRFLPALISTVAIYGMYLLASALLTDRYLGAWSALVYALTPRSFAWLIMGGGLTRSLGYTFFLFAGWSVYRLFQEGSRKWLVLSVLFSGLTILSHPEAAIHAASFCIFLWLSYGRSWRSFTQAIIVAIGVLLFSVPWWGTVLHYHGLGPFLSVINTGMHGSSLLGRFWLAIYPNEGLLPVLPVLFLLAIVWGILNKKYFLLIWVVLPCIVEPRSGIYVVLFPISMLLASLFGTVITGIDQKHGMSDAAQKKNINRILFALVIYLFIESYFYGYRLVNNSLTTADLDAMTWVHEHTLAGSRFVLLTGNTAPELDAFQEWFPVLTDRQSLTTFQGTEWTLGPLFFTNFKELITLQTCKTAECLQGWLMNNLISFDYLLVLKKNTALIDSLRPSAHYEMIYEDEGMVLFSPK